VAPRAALAVSDLDQAAAAIRARGGRLSWSRRIVLAALFAADGPVSAPDIASGLDGRLTACAVSSVYRNLRDLEALDVVRQVHIADGPALYAVEDGGEQAYVLCERCERVQTIDAQRLDCVHAEIRRALNFRTRFTHFPLVGLCHRCAASSDTHDGDHALAS
jgi:Fur family ferric uptake transcriptional regulator